MRFTTPTVTRSASMPLPGSSAKGGSDLALSLISTRRRIKELNVNGTFTNSFPPPTTAEHHHLPLECFGGKRPQIILELAPEGSVVGTRFTESMEVHGERERGRVTDPLNRGP
jgi:hypothetical protein